MMTQCCFAARVFVDAIQIEISSEGDIALWFEPNVNAPLDGWSIEEIGAQFRAEAREVAHELLRDLPVTWVASDDDGRNGRGEYYRAEVSSRELEALIAVVRSRAR